MHGLEHLQPANIVQVIAGGGTLIGMVIGSQYPRVGVAFAPDDLPCLPDSQYFFSFQLSKVGESLAEVEHYLDPDTYYSLYGVQENLSLMQSMLVGY